MEDRVERQITPWMILTQSPFKIYDRQEQSQRFSDMLKNTLAPYYQIKSLTTILIFIPLIIYITLVVRYPPFLMIPNFASQSLQLRPQNLRHYQFYRVFTSIFVYEQFSTLLISCLVIWSFGSFTEQFLGRRMLIVFTGFYGLIGYAYYLTLPCFLIGCNFAYALIVWPDPTNPIIYRKITLVLYFIIGLVYFLLFINFPIQQKYSSYIATFYGIIMTFILGIEKDGENLATHRKVLQLASTIIFIVCTSLLLLNIVLYRITII